jgi:hypothetical protein
MQKQNGTVTFQMLNWDRFLSGLVNTGWYAIRLSGIR